MYTEKIHLKSFPSDVKTPWGRQFVASVKIHYFYSQLTLALIEGNLLISSFNVTNVYCVWDADSAFSFQDIRMAPLLIPKLLYFIGSFFSKIFVSQKPMDVPLKHLAALMTTFPIKPADGIFSLKRNMNIEK